MREDNKKKITYYMDNVAGRRVDMLHRQILSFDASLRGVYDYCRVPGTRQLSPLEVGEDKKNSNLSIWLL